MNESFSVPDEKLRQESVKNLQQVQKKLDLFGLEIEEVLGIANAKLLRQRRKRLENSVNNSIN
ncbi:hypothetical protein [Crocosphaera watsonii]|uniref:Uncharacterized protein n=1 Tax=Crocosphaera watsonii WH 8502 TaxID=423474 RepID=T2IIV5_CROWT|nr:hypothetical protein [Crocosphaera watsonii]CCQ52978.1 hypothetical protein CWATWH8502_1061 [Crocosphaera watsonii WH 8502]